MNYISFGLEIMIVYNFLGFFFYVKLYYLNDVWGSEVEWECGNGCFKLIVVLYYFF